VVSVVRGRTTGTRSRSHWNCMSAEFTVAPPSTGARVVSFWRRFHRSKQVGALVGNALECGASDVRRLRPAREADDGATGGGIQCGAPRPVNAGTR